MHPSTLIALLLVAAVSVLNADVGADVDEGICQWRGSAPVCIGECETEEHKVKEAATAAEAVPYQATFGKECWYGKKYYCCQRNVTADADADLNRVETRFANLNN
ncbi:hypothetical protein PRIPAC_97391 [Pristionchus pacificus]|uniref:Uncharacterized protein n=1 Tax=Pristionchus pacificus TaxID=54126 RepID=A0A454Y2H6_PRIPA|nr:hypothetical protein PRIPAC_97391 [Pristionchus pacificus]|eukprot:PDM77428.1 hypothetical protein PRIPAC_33158 [Pristionchus pacificus]